VLWHRSICSSPKERPGSAQMGEKWERMEGMNGEKNKKLMGMINENK